MKESHKGAQITFSCYDKKSTIEKTRAEKIWRKRPRREKTCWGRQRRCTNMTFYASLHTSIKPLHQVLAQTHLNKLQENKVVALFKTSVCTSPTANDHQDQIHHKPASSGFIKQYSLFLVFNCLQVER